MSNKSQSRKLAWLLSSLVVLLLIVFFTAIALNLVTAEKFLYQGRDNLNLAYKSMERADFKKTAYYFKKAEDGFTGANENLNNQGIKLLTFVPVAGKNLTVLGQVASIGLEVTLAGESFTQASSKFPQRDGKIDPEFAGGKINLDSFIAARPYMEDANQYVLQASAKFSEMPKSYLFLPIKKAKDELGKQLPKIKSLVANTKIAFDTLPDVLGSNGKRRYFLAIQNNAELRATGGLIGNYGIISVDRGKVTLESFDEIHKLQLPNQSPVDAPRDFVDRYGAYKGTSLWINTNMSPDFPTVSKVLLELYKSVTGVDLDGVISIDPVGLKYLLTATGPIKISDGPVSVNEGNKANIGSANEVVKPQPVESINIDSNNVINWTLVEAYKKYQDRTERKDFLADVAKAVWQNMISGQGIDKMKLIDELKHALSEKHMALYSTHQDEQGLAETLGYAGAITPTSSDYLQVVEQNHGGNKVDVYMHEKINYTVKLHSDGFAESTVSVDFKNDTPLTGLPPYVTGEVPLGAKGGSSTTWLNVYVPKDSQLVDVFAPGDNNGVDTSREKDKTVFSRYLEIAPGAVSETSLSYKLPDVLRFDNGKAFYTLDWQAQPVINSPNITVQVVPPDGFEFSNLPDGFKRRGRDALFSDKLVKDERFEFTLVDNR